MSVYTRSYSSREGSEFQFYDGFSIEFRPKAHRYWIHRDGEREPAVSVTTALRVLDKPALLRWAEDAGAAGAAQLAALGELEDVAPQDVGALVRERGLGMDAKREEAAERGTSIHKVLEQWARTETVPDVADFPPEHQGYVMGLCAWLLRMRPEPSSVERFVGSVKHGYAGRLDLRAVLQGRDTLIDLKTSKRGTIYPEAHVQARAYAMADVECGSRPPERVLIVGVAEDGAYQTADCCATGRDWLDVLATYRAMSRIRNDARPTDA